MNVYILCSDLSLSQWVCVCLCFSLCVCMCEYIYMALNFLQMYICSFYEYIISLIISEKICIYCFVSHQNISVSFKQAEIHYIYLQELGQQWDNKYY